MTACRLLSSNLLFFPLLLFNASAIIFSLAVGSSAHNSFNTYAGELEIVKTFAKRFLLVHGCVEVVHVISRFISCHFMLYTFPDVTGPQNKCV